ncbi:MAG: ATP-dependent DNA ligase [Deltaproteobacteria bacterium]|nr:ATP-dependent DNA ligase [Deltaproteobacteria bacterium]
MAKHEGARKRRYGRYSVETSNEDKVLFAESGITKGQLIDYHERIAERMLPHLRERPLVLQRFPDGVDAGGFYQKQASDYFPDWIPRVRVGVGDGSDSQELVVCDMKATLGYLANQACVTLHPWLSRRDALDCPDTLIIDLDPATDDFEAVRQAALWTRTLLDELELPGYVKLTGSKGVHVAVPLDRSADFDTVRAFARDAMDLLAGRHPDALTTEHRKAKRAGRLYLDVARNAYAQTAVAPWSVRPRPGAPVAAPIPWSALESKGLGPRDFTIANVFERIADRDDPWDGMRRHARSLGPARERLTRLSADEAERSA